MCEVESMNEEQARRVGALAGKARHDDVVDVCAVERALRRHDAVVTSNESDIRKISKATSSTLRIVAL